MKRVRRRKGVSNWRFMGEGRAHVFPVDGVERPGVHELVEGEGKGYGKVLYEGGKFAGECAARMGAYHHGKSFGTDIKGQDLQSICNKHRSVCQVVKEIEEENERKCCCMQHCQTMSNCWISTDPYLWPRTDCEVR